MPNLITLAGALKPIMREKSEPMNNGELTRLLDERFSLEDKLKNYRSFVYPRYPLVMAEWFRRKFSDACHWYNARLAFTRTAGNSIK